MKNKKKLLTYAVEAAGMPLFTTLLSFRTESSNLSSFLYSVSVSNIE